MPTRPPDPDRAAEVDTDGARHRRRAQRRWHTALTLHLGVQGVIELLSLAALIVAMAACAPAAAAPDDEAPPNRPPAERALLFAGVTLLDGISPEARADQSVLVLGDRIAAVGPRGSLDLPDDVISVPCEGDVLMPGLIDAHAHLSYWGDGALVELVDAGVTTARDMGGDLDAQLELRAAIERGDRLGPDLVLCGPFLEGSESEGEHRLHVDTPEQARAAVRQLAARGVDFVKLQPLIEREVAAAAVDEAATHGLAVVGHLPHGLTPLQATELGLHSLEHIEVFLGLDDAALDATFEAMRARDAWLSPAIFGMQAALEARGADVDADPRLRRAREVLARAHAAGVSLLVGSNFAFPDWPQQPGSGLHGELRAFVDAGIPAADVLRMATHGNARFLGRDDEVGSVRPGLRADLLLLHDDPLADIAHSSAQRYVMLRGFLFGPRER